MTRRTVPAVPPGVAILDTVYAGSEVGPRLRRLIDAKRGARRISAVARDAGVPAAHLINVLGGRKNTSRAWLARVLAAIPATEEELWDSTSTDTTPRPTRPSA